MNKTIKRLLQSFKYVFSAQMIILIIGFLKALIVPLILSIEDFGYWQIYLLYSSFVGVFALGFNDGIYLRYGNYHYKDLPHERLRGAIRVHTLILSLFSLAMLTYAMFISSAEKQFAFYFISFNITILGLNGVFIYILQITNQMKKYSFYSILSKVIVIISIVLFAILEIKNYEYLIIIDVLANLIVVIGMIFISRELWFGKTASIFTALSEYKIDVAIGIKLMIAQLMGMLLLGIGRFIIEIFGSIEEYAYYSFGVTVTNLVLVLITSISLVLYPTLKRLEEKNFPRYFEKISSIVRISNYFVPILFLTSTLIIPMLLSKYSPVLEFLNILFAIIMIQSKMQMLNNTFYKALRKEKEMMVANLNSVIAFIFLSLILYSIFNNVLSVVLSTFVVMLLRSVFSEIYLRKTMNITNYFSIRKDCIYLCAFVLLSSILSLKQFTVVYTVFLIYLILKNYKEIFRFTKLSLQKESGNSYGS